MKRRLYILLIIVCVLPINLHAEQRRNNGVHYLAPTVSVAYFNLLDNVATTKSAGGLSTSLGLNYEFRYKQLWVSAGIDAQYYFSNVAIDDNNRFSQSAYDTQGKQMTLHYQMQSDNEHLDGLNFGLPIMIGWQSNHGFYMGAGTRVWLNAISWNKAILGYTTSATYEQYIVDFADMTNHFYQPYTSSSRQQLRLEPEVGILAEAGVDVLAWYYNTAAQRRPILKIGVFAEYGVLNAISNKGDKTRYSVNQDNPIYLDINPFYNAIDSRTNKFAPLTIGIKISYLFQQKSSWCNCYE